MTASINRLRPMSESPIGERLRLEMKKQSLSSVELARRAGVKTSFLYDVISGKSANPSTVRLARVADILGVSLAYLAGGNNLAPQPDAILTLHTAIEPLAIDAAGNICAADNEHYYFRTRWIEGHLHAAPSDLRMLRVHGDGMEPTIKTGDMALIDISKRTPSPPGVFIVFDGAGLVPKRLEYAVNRGARHIRILSDNPQYSAYERSADDMAIIGRVVWFAREI